MERGEVLEIFVRAADAIVEAPHDAVKAAIAPPDTPAKLVEALIGNQPREVLADQIVQIYAWQVAGAFKSLRRALGELARAIEHVAIEEDEKRAKALEATPHA